MQGPYIGVGFTNEQNNISCAETQDTVISLI